MGSPEWSLEYLPTEPFLLFSLFMNDFPNIINPANIVICADDVNFFLSLLLFNNFIEHVYLQGDLNNFAFWCEYNILELNIKKCIPMRFSRNNFIVVNYFVGGDQLEIVDSFIDFGILLDTKLNFNDHIALTANKAALRIACQTNFGLWIHPTGFPLYCFYNPSG